MCSDGLPKSVVRQNQAGIKVQVQTPLLVWGVLWVGPPRRLLNTLSSSETLRGIASYANRMHRYIFQILFIICSSLLYQISFWQKKKKNWPLLHCIGKRVPQRNWNLYLGKCQNFREIKVENQLLRGEGQEYCKCKAEEGEEVLLNTPFWNPFLLKRRYLPIKTHQYL